jgi:hypothetical protein
MLPVTGDIRTGLGVGTYSSWNLLCCPHMGLPCPASQNKDNEAINYLL